MFTPTFSLSAFVDNSEATWKKNYKMQQIDLFCLTNLLNLVILSFFLDITSGLDEEEMLDAVEDAFWSK